MKIAIIGAGIAGLTMAVALKKNNIDSVVFEANPVIKAVGAGLGLAANAIKAFDTIGLKKELINRGHLLRSFTVYDQHGKKITKTDSLSVGQKYGLDNFTIHRTELHAFLLEQLAPKNLFTGKKLVSLQQENENVNLSFQDGDTYQADFVIVADGIHSVARQQLLPGSKPRYAGYTCWRAVIDSIDLNFPDSSEIWGPKGRFGIVPLKDNKIYWFACINSPQNNPDTKKYKIEDLLQQFKGYPADVEAVLKKTKNKGLLWNDIIDLKPISKFAFGRTVLIGDAAHATTPNMGQGACQAIEDAVWLAQTMGKQDDFQQVFRSFEKSRLERVHWVTDTSWKIGKAAQISNPVLAAIRNFVFRMLPSSFNDKVLKRLYEVSFPS